MNIERQLRETIETLDEPGLKYRLVSANELAVRALWGDGAYPPQSAQDRVVANALYQPGTWSPSAMTSRPVADPIDLHHLRLIDGIVSRSRCRRMLAVGPRAALVQSYLRASEDHQSLRVLLADQRDGDLPRESRGVGDSVDERANPEQAIGHFAPDSLFIDGNQPYDRVAAVFEAACQAEVPTILFCGHASRARASAAGRRMHAEISRHPAYHVLCDDLPRPPQETARGLAVASRSRPLIRQLAQEFDWRTGISGGRSIYVVIADERSLEMARVALPRLARYAAAVSAELNVLHELQGHHPTPHFIKLDLFQDALNRGLHQALYLDTDIIIARDAPSIFELDGAALYSECAGPQRDLLSHMCDLLFHTSVLSSGRYFNTGVMLFDHDALVRMRDAEQRFFNRSSTDFEQAKLNAMLATSGVHVTSLAETWNYPAALLPPDAALPNFLHFLNILPYPERLRRMQAAAKGTR